MGARRTNIALWTKMLFANEYKLPLRINSDFNWDKEEKTRRDGETEDKDAEL